MDTTSPSLLQRLSGPLDQVAWSRFVEIYTPLIYSWARQSGLSENDAADLIQEVFALLIQKLPEFEYDESKSFRGWLRTVTLNKWRQLQRKRQLRTDDETGRFEALPDSQHDDSFWECEYQQQLLRRAMKMVSAEFQPLTWKAFSEYVVAGRDPGAVAKELGLRPTGSRCWCSMAWACGCVPGACSRAASRGHARIAAR